MQNSKIKNFFFAIILSGSSVLTGCGEEKTDNEIAASVMSALHKDNDLANVNVAVHEGIATLTGWVTSQQIGTHAEEIVMQAEEVQDVVNKLAIGANPAEQEQLSTAVSKALVGYDSINAIISDSVVVLSGSIHKADMPGLQQKLEALKVKKIVTKNIVVK